VNEFSRRRLLTGALGVAAAAGVAACSSGARSGTSGVATAPLSPTPTPTLVGDGSTAPMGAQPHQPAVHRLGPGQRPPQFVVFSWDGAGETGRGLFARYRAAAADTKASMTFFLSGIYLLPERKKLLYRPPHKPVGASAIGYLSDPHIRMTLQQLRAAWLEGHEIGTHFNGHFCDAAGVGTWSPADWRNEIDQAVGFVEHWRTNTGFRDVAPLPFDYRKELIGGRTPCLLGQNRLLPTAAALRWRYDASSPGGEQRWPGKRLGVWDFPLQSIPVPGRAGSVLSMDYNLMYKQLGGSINGPAAQRPRWQAQATGAYLAGFHRAYTTNRAPYFIGNHFENWNGGIYMRAVEEALRTIATYPDVRLVSFRQLVGWLDAQDPTVLRRLRTLNVGQHPTDWREYTAPLAAATAAAPSA